MVFFLFLFLLLFPFFLCFFFLLSDFTKIRKMSQRTDFLCQFIALKIPMETVSVTIGVFEILEALQLPLSTQTRGLAYGWRNFVLSAT